MKKKGFRIVSLLVAISLVALIAVQVLSIVSSYRSMNAQFMQKVKGAMERAAYDELVTRSQKKPLSEQKVTAVTAFSDSEKLLSDTINMKISDISAGNVKAITINKTSDTPVIEIKSKGMDSIVAKQIPGTKIKDATMYVLRMNYDSDRSRFKLLSYDTLLQKNLSDAGINSQYLLVMTEHSGDNDNTDYVHDEVPNPVVVSIPLDTKGEVLLSVEIENPSLQFFTDMRWIIISSGLILVLLVFTFWYLLHTLFRQKTLEELRRDFTHNITHELKTPIAVANAANDAMLNFEADRDPAKRAEYLTVVHDQLNLLSDMVQRILSMTTLEKVDYRLSLSDCRLDLLLAEVTAAIRMKYPKEITISTSITPQDLVLHVDEFHFRNVLSNILDNAVKYSPDRVEVKITASIFSSSEMVQIRISDHGIGISPSDCRRIFDKFYRVPTKNLHEVKGTGLGLYYAQLIVEKHGGSISAESEVGQGTDIVINLPR